MDHQSEETNECKEINEDNLELLRKVIRLAKQHKIKSRITCGVISVELGDAANNKED